MLCPSWLRNWRLPTPAARRGHRTSPAQRVGFRPRLEALEDRTVPSTLTSVSARDLIADLNAVNLAGGTHTIILAPGVTFSLNTANNTVHGPTGLPVIGRTKPVDLTIIGNGDTIQRTGGFGYNRRGEPTSPFRLFDVAPGASLTLDGVRLQGGWANGGGPGAEGGAVYNQGTLTVRNGSTFSVNSAGDGGAIFNAGGTVTVSDSRFLGGSMQVGKGTVAFGNFAGNGGALYNDAGTLTISNTTLSASSALFFGGALYNNAGTLTILNSTLSENGARFGGGVYNLGGAVTVTGSTLSGNAAHHADYPWAGGDGGAVYNSGGTLAIVNSTLSGNTADMYFGTGGGIYNTGGAVRVSNSTLSGNTALDAGGLYNGDGGTVTFENASRMAGNEADGLAEDVRNLGVVCLDGISEIGVLDGNPAVLI